MYTIAEESYYFLIHNVPNLGVEEELKDLCMKHGKVVRYDLGSLEVVETEVKECKEKVLVKAASVKDARRIKKKIHKRAFFGYEILLEYKPEMESVGETRAKLQEHQNEMLKERDEKVVKKRRKI